MSADALAPTAPACHWCSGRVLRRGEAALLMVPSFEPCDVPEPASGPLCCTRRIGHSGDHVACGFHFHGVRSWPGQS